MPDSVFVGDTVRLAAEVYDEVGARDTTASVEWTVSDPRLAEAVGEGVFALLQPGTVRVTARAGTVAATYALVIGRLVAQRVELTPDTINVGRTDRVPVTARVLGQGGRVITGRTIAFSSDDSLVAIVLGPATSESSMGLLLALGPGSTTIRARVDDAVGTARVGVVDADTTFALTDYEGSSLPVLVLTDSVVVDGEKRFLEIYADSGTLVLSGLLQERYELDIEYSVYRTIESGGTTTRERLFQVRGQFDRGIVTTSVNGTLSMLSEIFGPHLEHTATPRADGYEVRYRIPGEDSFLELRYVRVAP